MRRLAEQAHTSSSAVYTLFGDKSGLVRETDVAMVLLGLVTGLASLELKSWLGTAEDAERRWDLALRTAL